MPTTLFEKLWRSHQVTSLVDGSALIYIDRVFLHERTGSIALKSLESSQRVVKNPRHVFCTMDHIIDTFPGRDDKTLMPGGTDFITATRDSALQAGIKLFDINDAEQGISHIVSAEQGITLPGLSVVCPDSHTCTLGALGAMAWGIGSSDCEHALATETLRVEKPKQMRVHFDGQLNEGVSAKDMILYLISQYGATGGEGMAVEFTGSVIASLNMEGRFTLCNMATEFSTFTAIIAPDETTLDYIKDKPYAPKNSDWTAANDYWRTLKSDSAATFDKEIHINCNEILPMVSWGTSPEHSINIEHAIPSLDLQSSSKSIAQTQSLDYMNLESGTPIKGTRIDAAFIGSCTNGRLADLQAAAKILAGKKVCNDIKAVCTPGSQQIKKAAEQLGLDEIFINAGFEWREPGCSLCFYAGGEGFLEGQRIISTTNRNFQGRQGRGARTHIASPEMVAAAAIAGQIVDCREYINAASVFNSEEPIVKYQSA